MITWNYCGNHWSSVLSDQVDQWANCEKTIIIRHRKSDLGEVASQQEEEEEERVIEVDTSPAEPCGNGLLRILRDGRTSS